MAKHSQDLLRNVLIYYPVPSYGTLTQPGVLAHNKLGKGIVQVFLSVFIESNQLLRFKIKIRISS